eukprot:1177176-Prorocentrum_minimum.AAC.1
MAKGVPVVSSSRVVVHQCHSPMTCRLVEGQYRPASALCLPAGYSPGDTGWHSPRSPRLPNFAQQVWEVALPAGRGLCHHHVVCALCEHLSVKAARIPPPALQQELG